ncbi:MAG: tetratricopeptide repeat protein [Deltaproteobacteria bacterium]|nr:tetratricopeptide repeat protein [Deltaproteobacteria bacterium]
MCSVSKSWPAGRGARARRAVLACVLALAVLAAGGRAAAQPRAAAPTPAAGAADERSQYQRHLDNGLMLFEEKNFAGAITEFRAAYRAEPKASPLINLALTFKQLGDYPKAIEQLRQALDKHADTMSADDQRAARRAIAEMEALLGHLSVRIEPASAASEAKLFINDEERGSVGQPIPLSPGRYLVEARLDGYEPAKKTVEVAAGEQERELVLVLQPTAGKLSVASASPQTWIEIDGVPKRQGAWEGLLAPGVHQVRVFLPGKPAQTIAVLAVAGKTHHVIQQADGKLATDSPLPLARPQDEKPAVPAAAGDEEIRGLYGMGMGSLLVLEGSDPVMGTDPGSPLRLKRDAAELPGGAAGSVRLGYRVATWAGFELVGQYSDLRVSGTYPEMPASVTYVVRSIRAGGALRVLLPGRKWVRFAGTVGAGIAYDEVDWLDAPTGWNGGDGLDGFGELDVGVELEISKVLLGLVLQNVVQSTKGLDDIEGPRFRGTSLFIVGPALYAGYGLW